MNIELVNKISGEAKHYALLNSYNDEEKYKSIYDVKFATLIVEECAKICTNFKFTVEGPAENAAYQRALCSVEIKERFGLMSKGPIHSKTIR